MDNPQILAAWETKLLYAHPESGSGKAIRAFLANPNEATRRAVGLNADGAVTHLASETITALGKLGDFSEERSSFLVELKSMVQ